MNREEDGTCSLHIEAATNDDDGNYTIMAANPQVRRSFFFYKNVGFIFFQCMLTGTQVRPHTSGDYITNQILQSIGEETLYVKMTDETTPLLDIQSKPLRTFFHVNNSCPISFPLSDADRYLLRCGDRTDMMFQAERIEQGETNSYIKFGTVSKHNYILYVGSKDVDLQIVSLPYTILFDLMCWLSCLFRSTFIRQLFPV